MNWTSHALIVKRILISLVMTASFFYAKQPYEYLQGFCEIGVRVPGTANHLKARDYIIEHLPSPVVDSFFTRETWFYNIYQRFPGSEGHIAIAVHWDCEPPEGKGLYY